VAFLRWPQITAWLARKQLVQPLELLLVQKLQQQERELQLVQPLAQELLLFYRKQPRQQQRLQLPKREICSFLKTK
jgi:hypothetical protein